LLIIPESEAMLRLSKKIEYGILALQYLAENSDKLVTAKVIAENLDISFEFLSKTLQALKKNNLVNTIQGMKGGYTLADSPDNISLMQIIEALEHYPDIVECVNSETCEREEYCSIRSPMHVIQEKINDIFTKMKLTDFLENKTVQISIN
jgi:Rrf2 family protein